jgi:predicted enzyme related to lactoylglutathione lyase
MNKGANTVIYPVSDLASSRVLFSRMLGVDPVVDQPYYVGFNVAGQDIGLDPTGWDRGMTGATPFWEVDDVRGTVAALTAVGATIAEDVREVGGGKLIAMLEDADGNMIGLAQTP